MRAGTDYMYRIQREHSTLYYQRSDTASHLMGKRAHVMAFTAVVPRDSFVEVGDGVILYSSA